MDDYDLGEKRNIYVVFNHLKYSDNYEKPKPKKRIGTEILVEAIQKTFSENLGFESMHDVGETAAQDFTKHQILQKLKQVFSGDFTTIGCVFVFILTHGAPNYTLCTQDQCYNFREVFDTAMDNASPTLNGKPIVFIVQACGGSKQDHGIIPGSSDDSESPNTQQQQAHDVPLLWDFVSKMCQSLWSFVSKFWHSLFRKPPSSFFLPANYPNVLMAFATPPEYVASRRLFIPTLCQTIDEYGHKHHFETLLTIAKQAVADEIMLDIKWNQTTKQIEEIRLCKQIPISTSTLTKKLRLPPGDTTTHPSI